MRWVIGLGSNQGDRLDSLRRAVSKLKQGPVTICAVSAVYESDALLPEGADPSWNQNYLNLALLCKTDLKPKALLKLLKETEADLGRKGRARWAPRPIDLDILAGEKEFNSPELQVPHPGLLDRPFALLPLADVWPEWTFLLQKGAESKGLKSAFELALKWRNPQGSSVPFQTRETPLPFTQLMGILNLTPDSFSDGGQLSAPESALTRAHSMIAAGASILDLGAESTRPGATALGWQEEWSRLEPILKTLSSSQLTKNVQLSVDTRHVDTAKRALEWGVSMINDVSGLVDPAMKELLVQSSCDCVVMHSLSVPADPKQVIPPEADPVYEVLEWGEKKLTELKRNGISLDRIILDPGIGFGKSAAQSLVLLQQCHLLHQLKVRILIGHSRKSFLTPFTKIPPSERDLETITASLNLMNKGIEILRVHNVEGHMRAMKVQTALSAGSKWL